MSEINNQRKKVRPNRPAKIKPTILNSREKKELNATIKEQWGVEFNKDFMFIKNNKDRVYIANKELGNITNLRLDKCGVYVCSTTRTGIRLTIEGSQLLGPDAQKNIHEITNEELEAWFKGCDLERKPDNSTGFLILKHKQDFVGCGKVYEKGILNFVPKARRITANIN